MGTGAQSIGAVFSIGVVGMCLGALFVAPIGDLIGRRGLILASVVLVGVAMTATGFATSLEQLMLARALTGLGIGAMLASLTAMVAEYAPERHRNLALGLLHTGYPIDAIIGGFIAALVIPKFG